MFIRIWHKAENVGRDDLKIEEYVAIRCIMRFYRRRHEGDAADRYLVVTGTETSYVTEETFLYLKSLRNRAHHSEPREGPPARLTRS